MREPLGDRLFYIAGLSLGFTFVAGWIVLILDMILQSIFPSKSDRIEKVTQSIMKPMGTLQKYSVYAAITLFAIRLIAGWMGWAPQINLTSDTPD